MAAAEALDGPQQCVVDMCDAYRQRRDVAIDDGTCVGDTASEVGTVIVAE